MQAAIDGKPFVQQYPIDADEPLFKKEISATDLWKKIVHNAWKSAEPGVLFWDTILREFRTRIATQTWVTVPCRPTLAVKSPCAPTTPAVCWPLTYIHM